jgi:hypothetical protein
MYLVTLCCIISLAYLSAAALFLLNGLLCLLLRNPAFLSVRLRTRVLPRWPTRLGPGCAVMAQKKALKNACGRGFFPALVGNDDCERSTRRCDGGWPSWVGMYVSRERLPPRCR